MKITEIFTFGLDVSVETPDGNLRDGRIIAHTVDEVGYLNGIRIEYTDGSWIDVPLSYLDADDENNSLVRTLVFHVKH